MFDHNAHQMEEAEQLAKSIGVNRINFVRPYNFTYDNVAPAKDAVARQIIFHFNGKPWEGRLRVFKDSLTDAINEEYDKFMDISGNKKKLQGEFGEAAKNLCRWLYEQTVMDANGRVMPCTAAPVNNSWFFANIVSDDVINSRGHLSARTLYADVPKPCDSCHMVESKPNMTSTIDFAGFLVAADFSSQIPASDISLLWTSPDVPHTQADGKVPRLKL
jgi:radical SAM protein with 4Fe4S-binding SPASM domain